eukprot:TRINITY_DN5959_c0_g2_i1.p1 TRINITY_DN5959_c0_g2~~TRINITY_DN5959_c0_g2_i1.p1  ORF type:complete len:277 (+),score=27.92 TRINITY_DN5959_c0_g2_i1:102-932(+)
MAGTDQSASSDDLPAAAFSKCRLANGDIVPEDIAVRVGEFAGGLLEHLKAATDAGLNRALKGLADTIKELEREAGDDQAVVHYEYIRKQDAVDLTRPHLDKVLPECLIGYDRSKGGDVTWHIVHLRPARAARTFIRQMKVRAQEGFSTHYTEFKFERIPVCVAAGIPDVVVLGAECFAYQPCTETMKRICFSRLLTRLAVDLSAALTLAGLPNERGNWADIEGVRAGAKEGVFVACATSVPIEGKREARVPSTHGRKETVRYAVQFTLTVAVAARW